MTLRQYLDAWVTRPRWIVAVVVVPFIALWLLSAYCSVSLIHLEKIARHLQHPGLIRCGRHPTEGHSPRREIDDKKHIECLQPFQAPDFDREEVTGCEASPMRLEEG
jgi:hypothetical protein